jgi:RNA polymerase sigma-70 factor (ECF subfamily)
MKKSGGMMSGHREEKIGMSSKERELVARIKEGDMDAFRELVEMHRDRIYAFVFYMTGDRSDADDITQETFIKAYKGLSKFRGDSSVYTWLHRIAMNLCIDRVRKLKKRKEVPLSEIIPSHVEEPFREAERSELRRIIEVALSGIPEKQRVILIMYEIQGFSYEEIASILGCPIGTVRSRLHKARNGLRERISKLL